MHRIIAIASTSVVHAHDMTTRMINPLKPTGHKSGP